MSTKPKKILNKWEKIGDGEAVVIQNIGAEKVEVATVKNGEEPKAGFILNDYEFFSYPGGDEVWVRSKNEISYIVMDNIGG